MIIVTSGKDRGKKGKVQKVLPKAHAVLVAGLNLYKRHLKKRDEKHPAGIVELPRPLSAGKIALVCSACHKPTRIGYLITKTEKIRVCRKCNQHL